MDDYRIPILFKRLHGRQFLFRERFATLFPQLQRYENLFTGMGGRCIDYGTFIAYRMQPFCLHKFHFCPALKIDEGCLIGTVISAVNCMFSYLSLLGNDGLVQFRQRIMPIAQLGTDREGHFVYAENAVGKRDVCQAEFDFRIGFKFCIPVIDAVLKHSESIEAKNFPLLYCIQNGIVH